MSLGELLKAPASNSSTRMAEGRECVYDSGGGQKRSRSNCGGVRRPMIEAKMNRNRSPAKQRRYLWARGLSFSRYFGRCPAVLGLKDVTRCAMSARETSVLSARSTLVRPGRNLGRHPGNEANVA